MILSYFFRLFRLFVFVFYFTYAFGMLWFTFVKIQLQLDFFENSKDGNNFIDQFELKENSAQSNMIACYYFAWTTLSTVGFGDFKPYSNVERMFMSVVFLTGVTVFSFIIGELLSAFEKTKALGDENEDYDNLSKLAGLLKKFNNGKLINEDFREEMT